MVPGGRARSGRKGRQTVAIARPGRNTGSAASARPPDACCQPAGPDKLADPDKSEKPIPLRNSPIFRHCFTLPWRNSDAFLRQ